jgi:enamine deaminase RidA (YjgF/YER057c/UK114 family)
MSAEARLKEKNITLPKPTSPMANYVGRRADRQSPLRLRSWARPRRQGDVSGQGRQRSHGRAGYQVAREVGLGLLATVRANLGSLDKVRRVVKVLGMVNSADGFGDQPKVINGFSDLMVEVFGEAIGKHARSAVGMGGLPVNIPVEIEMVLEVE